MIKSFEAPLNMGWISVVSYGLQPLKNLLFQNWHFTVTMSTYLPFEFLCSPDLSSAIFGMCVRAKSEALLPPTLLGRVGSIQRLVGRFLDSRLLSEDRLEPETKLQDIVRGRCCLQRASSSSRSKSWNRKKTFFSFRKEPALDFDKRNGFRKKPAFESRGGYQKSESGCGCLRAANASTLKFDVRYLGNG